MSHYSPVPPEDRVYAKNYRKELQGLEAQVVEVSGRVKEFRDHPERSDLQSMLLVNLVIHPLPRGKPRKAIKLPHLWVLTKHVTRLGIEPKRNRRITFQGSVYAYYRLGGKSKQRGLHGFHDFSILPMGQTELETFTPGINQRYANNDIEDHCSNGRADQSSKRGGGELGESSAERAQPDSHCGHRNHRHLEQRP